MNKDKTIIWSIVILIVYLILVSAFVVYWQLVRPAMIVKKCWGDAEKVMEEIKGEENSSERIRLIWDVRFKRFCLAKQGLLQSIFTGDLSE
ncbi:MAG: hypothetical protein KatS3mg097_559 [Candidatus Parcubacteria bacterium]|nr:MAG: hypothetical protein KatS3mg097_559 [Candidatus Parcubacteria bacterium]